jgi:hypothetical protein
MIPYLTFPSRHTMSTYCMSHELVHRFKNASAVVTVCVCQALYTRPNVSSNLMSHPTSNNRRHRVAISVTRCVHSRACEYLAVINSGVNVTEASLQCSEFFVLQCYVAQGFARNATPMVWIVRWADLALLHLAARIPKCCGIKEKVSTSADFDDTTLETIFKRRRE